MCSSDLIKFLICKSTPQIVYECLECLGGNGYTEDLPMARYFRESPLNAIWEGSGNVMALDVLRAAGRAPDEAMATVAALARTASAAFDVRPLADTLGRILRSGDAERRARFVCEGLARIAALDPGLHAYITVSADLAREQAAVAEAELASGIDRGPLHGIPVGLKDLYATRGIRTTAHSRVLEDWVPDEDATAVVQIGRAHV